MIGARVLEARSLPIAPLLEADRDRLVMAISGSVVDHLLLNAESEAGVAALVEGHIFDVLEIADSLAAAMAELQATADRIERHGRTHLYCRQPGCTTMGALRENARRLQRRVADELAALQRGRR